MVAAPQFGSLIFVGDSGQHYSVDAYFSDVVGGLVRFSAGGAAGAATLDHWTCPEGVRLVDMAILTGMTDTTLWQVLRDGNATGDMVRFANHLNTLNSRPILNIPFAGGQQVGGTQLA